MLGFFDNYLFSKSIFFLNDLFLGRKKKHVIACVLIILSTLGVCDPL